MQPGAIFILEFANKQNLKAILRYLLRRQSWSPFTLEPVEFAALNFDFHPQAVRDCLEAGGFCHPTPADRIAFSHRPAQAHVAAGPAGAAGFAGAVDRQLVAVIAQRLCARGRQRRKYRQRLAVASGSALLPARNAPMPPWKKRQLVLTAPAAGATGRCKMGFTISASRFRADLQGLSFRSPRSGITQTRAAAYVPSIAGSSAAACPAAASGR